TSLSSTSSTAICCILWMFDHGGGLDLTSGGVTIQARKLPEPSSYGWASNWHQADSLLLISTKPHSVSWAAMLQAHAIALTAASWRNSVCFGRSFLRRTSCAQQMSDASCGSKLARRTISSSWPFKCLSYKPHQRFACPAISAGDMH